MKGKGFVLGVIFFFFFYACWGNLGRGFELGGEMGGWIQLADLVPALSRSYR